MRAFGETSPKYDIVLNGKPVTIMFSGRTWPPKPISVDLILPGQRQQRIWSFDEEPRRITKTEYEKLFGDQ
jgi:hypothetical protein